MAGAYQTIGRSYARTRRQDPRIASAIFDALGTAASVVNVGAGTGNDEPPDRVVVAVEPSSEMIRQRRGGSSRSRRRSPRRCRSPPPRSTSPSPS